MAASHLKYNDPEWRNVFAIPQSDVFFNLLQDRLHTSVENFLTRGDTRFTIFLNAIGRKAPQRYRRNESPKFIYAGVTKQRLLLRENFSDRWKKEAIPIESLNKQWHTLEKTAVDVKSSKVSSEFYIRILDGSFKLEHTCKINTLKDYFAIPSQGHEELQIAEKKIIQEYFSIEEDIFISIPLIGFGEIDGVAHIVLKKELIAHHTQTLRKDENDETHPYLTEDLLWLLIRSFIIEYEGIFLDWDQAAEETVGKITAIQEFVLRTVFEGDEYFNQRLEHKNRPIILRELGLKAYYKRHAEYFRERFELAAGVPSKIYQQYITNAVTAILIDSYAHNVSAHALSTLAWWFYRQADILRDEELDWEAMFDYLKDDADIDPVILSSFRQVIEGREEKRILANKNEDKKGQRQHVAQIKGDARAIRAEDGREIIRYPGSMARELAQLLRFLTEKGAFWSGVTRDINIGGKVSSLYSTLWYDFLNNPLYLGAIAKTEDIMRIKLRIVLYEPEPLADREETTTYHTKHYQRENSGIFAEVDLANPRPTLHAEEAITPHDKTMSVFVKKGESFEHFREKLKNVKIYFPGGVVGRHAFYTMIENEIRNVKHYSREELQIMQKEGLTVVIGIQPWSLRPTNKLEVYRISVWLDTPTRLRIDGEHLIQRKWDTLEGKPFNEDTYVPQLGGTSQDKVCGGFLVNDNFSSVQRGDRDPSRDKSKDSEFHKRHYPWVRPACSPEEKDGDSTICTHIDYKISYNNPTEFKTIEDPNDPHRDPEALDKIEIPILDENIPARGYLKKIFYMWRGERVLEWSEAFINNVNAASWDNPSRYNLVYLPEQLATPKQDALGQEIDPLYILRRKEGIVRVAIGKLTATDENTRHAEGYKLWLHTLLGKDKDLHAQVIMREGNQPRHVLALQKKESGELHFVKEGSVSGQRFSPLAMQVFASTDETNRMLIAHRENDATKKEELCIRYRNHGIYKSQFIPDGAPPHSEDDTLMMELFEVLATKICIFDNRAYHRMRLDKDLISGYQDFLREKLKLAVFKETTPSPDSEYKKWSDSLKKEELTFISNCHFLVMHLSYIESILPSEIPNLPAEDRSNVGLFIQKYILPLVGERENFFFVVTTGRGRNEWWTSLDQGDYRDFSKFTIFRPVESLLTAIENSVSMKDDFELKYRIAKVMYGS